jgi:hypothetical protein
MKNPKNTLALDMRCEEEGRCVVQLSIDFLTPGEREWLFALLKSATEGRQMAFGVETTPTKDAILRFFLMGEQEANESLILPS